MSNALPSHISIAPELLTAIDSVLRGDETQGDFIVAALRGAIERRLTQNCFDERSVAALAHYEQTGASSPAREVVSKLEAMLDKRRDQLRG